MPKGHSRQPPVGIISLSILAMVFMRKVAKKLGNNDVSTS